MKTIILETIDITPLIKAYNNLQEYSQQKSKMAETATVKTFEYTYELSWKVLKKVLKEKGLEEKTPRDVFRSAADIGYIKDTQPWFTFIKICNESSHTYNDEMFDRLAPYLMLFKEEVNKLIKTLQNIT